MQTFNNIVSKAFSVPAASVNDSMTSKDIPGWDSMNYLLFIAELEKTYNVSLTMDEVMNAKSLGDVRKALASKGAQV